MGLSASEMQWHDTYSNLLTRRDVGDTCDAHRCLQSRTEGTKLKSSNLNYYLAVLELLCKQKTSPWLRRLQHMSFKELQACLRVILLLATEGIVPTAQRCHEVQN